MFQQLVQLDPDARISSTQVRHRLGLSCFIVVALQVVPEFYRAKDVNFVSRRGRFGLE